jgi:hypothetical protein
MIAKKNLRFVERFVFYRLIKIHVRNCEHICIVYWTGFGRESWLRKNNIFLYSKREGKIGSIFETNTTIFPPLPHPHSPYGFHMERATITFVSRLIKSLKFIQSIKCEINYSFIFFTLENNCFDENKLI